LGACQLIAIATKRERTTKGVNISGEIIAAITGVIANEKSRLQVFIDRFTPFVILFCICILAI